MLTTTTAHDIKLPGPKLTRPQQHMGENVCRTIAMDGRLSLELGCPVDVGC